MRATKSHRATLTSLRVGRNLRWLGPFLGLLLLAVLLGSVPPVPAHAAVGYDSQELAFLELINQYRAEQGRAPLALSGQLSLTAERHSSDMAKYGFFSHVSEQSDYYPVGSHSWDRMRLDGYDAAHTTGENLGAGMAEAASALSAWKGSPTHNSNMLDPGEGSNRTVWRVIGIARALDPSTGVWYWTTEFGTAPDGSDGQPPATPDDAANPSFTDVPATHPYAPAVAQLAERNVVDGYTDGSFGLNDPLLRQQFTKLAVNALGYTPSEADRCVFPDVDSSGPASLYPDNYIGFAWSRGIVEGNPNGLFAPLEPVSRAQAISMVVRAVSWVEPGRLAPPSVAFNGPWGEFSPIHSGNVRIAAYNGLLQGLPLAQLDPWGRMPRGEIAQILFNLSQL